MGWHARVVAALVLAGGAWPALAVDLPKINAGQWEVMTVVEDGQPFVRRECLAENHLIASAATKLPSGENCVDQGVRKKGNSYIREMRCTGANGKTEIRRGQWTVMSDAHLENKSERVVNGKTDVIAQVSLVRTGSCPSSAPR